jgi:hypothetical protein
MPNAIRHHPVHLASHWTMPCQWFRVTLFPGPWEASIWCPMPLGITLDHALLVVESQTVPWPLRSEHLMPNAIWHHPVHLPSHWTMPCQWLSVTLLPGPWEARIWCQMPFGITLFIWHHTGPWLASSSESNCSLAPGNRGFYAKCHLASHWTMPCQCFRVTPFPGPWEAKIWCQMPFGITLFHLASHWTMACQWFRVKLFPGPWEVSTWCQILFTWHHAGPWLASGSESHCSLVPEKRGFDAKCHLASPCSCGITLDHALPVVAFLDTCNELEWFNIYLSRPSCCWDMKGSQNLVIYWVYTGDSNVFLLYNCYLSAINDQNLILNNSCWKHKGLCFCNQHYNQNRLLTCWRS